MPQAQRLLPQPGMDDLQTTSYVDLGEDPDAGMMTGDLDEDGNQFVSLGGADEEDMHPSQRGGEFFDNLADGIIPEEELTRIAQELLQKIDEDKEARKKRDEQYEEGIRRTGIGKDAPGGASFEGASKVVHPGLMEAVIDGEARLMKELWPANGPVKANILGKVTAEKQARADRKTAFMNHQLKTMMPEAFDTFESMLTQVMLGGSQFIKLYWDHRVGRPRVQFAPVDKCILQSSAASLLSASRRTFSENIDQVEYKRRVESGQYRESTLPPPSLEPDQTKSEEASNKIEGKTANALNVDGEREVYETMAYLEVTAPMADVLKYEEVGKLYPYLIAIDVSNRKVLSFYRDWEEEDSGLEPIDHHFEFPMIPWRGAMSIGFGQAIGGLSGASTGALRALLDTAHISNAQGGYVRKGSGIGGQNRRPNPGELTEIDFPLEAKDIREVVLPFKTAEPSETLFRLLGALVDTQKGVVRTTLDESPSDAPSPNTPVGTQLSRVEEGLTVFSSIHKRIHTAFNRFLMGLHRLNRLYLPEVMRIDMTGKEVLIMRKDFDGMPDVQPTSDPNIYSDRQRFEQISAIQQRQAVLKTAGINLYNDRELEVRFLKLMKIPDYEGLLIAEQKPQELNAVNENVAMAFGRPVTVFPDQDHLAHLQVHLDFARSPALGGNPVLAQKFLPAFLQHCAEHMVYHYVTIANNFVSDAAETDATALFSQDGEVNQEMDQVLAMASMRLVPGLDHIFGKALPLLEKAFGQLQAMLPPPPMDPAQAAAKAAMDETKRRTEADRNKEKLDGAKHQAKTGQDAATLQAKQAKDDADAADKARRLQFERDKQAEDAEIERDRIAADLTQGREDNDSTLTETLIETKTALEIAEENRKAASAKASRMKTGSSLSKGGKK